MDDEKITIRMGTDEIQIMESYLLDHPELGSRSNFMRTAVREYINRDADRTPADTNKSGTFIEFTKFERSVIDKMLETEPFIGLEEFVRNCVRNVLEGKHKDLLAEMQAVAREVSL